MTEFLFKGKEFLYNHHLAVPFRPLIPIAAQSLGTPSLDGNLIIHGDNLDALKALLPFYAGSVDCIFIDPPYNTGNEGWRYNDNVNAPMIKEWLSENSIGLDDSLRHDKWCAMMWPRLRLLYELLHNQGSIWIALDDNEMHRARGILDEIFGEECFICTIVVRSNKRGQTYKDIAKTHEYIQVYGKTTHSALHELETDGSNLPDEDQYGSYSSRLLRNTNPKFGRFNRPNLFYPLFVRNDLVDEQGNNIVSVDTIEGGEEVYPTDSAGKDGCWRWGKDRSAKFTQEGSTQYIYAARTRTGEWRIFEKYRKATIKAKTVWLENKHISDQGTRTLGKLGMADQFQFPKPLGVIEDVLNIATDRESVILDSFAGSGTTAHAVINANLRDGGNRKFILVEMECYAGDLTAERVRRVLSSKQPIGLNRQELYRERLTWKKLQNAERIVNSVRCVERKNASKYADISKSVEDGDLVVLGDDFTNLDDRSYSDSFTYCEMGDPIELDEILTGRDLPPFSNLGAVLFHMATSIPIDKSAIRERDYYLGESEDQHVWMVYRPDICWLRSADAALSLSLARKIAKFDQSKSHTVFASALYVGRKVLRAEGINVEFVPLPYALHRVGGRTP